MLIPPEQTLEEAVGYLVGVTMGAYDEGGYSLYFTDVMRRALHSNKFGIQPESQFRISLNTVVRHALWKDCTIKANRHGAYIITFYHGGAGTDKFVGANAPYNFYDDQVKEFVAVILEMAAHVADGKSLIGFTINPR